MADYTSTRKSLNIAFDRPDYMRAAVITMQRATGNPKYAATNIIREAVNAWILNKIQPEYPDKWQDAVKEVYAHEAKTFPPIEVLREEAKAS